MDSWIRIRIHTKMSWIRNTDLFLPAGGVSEATRTCPTVRPTSGNPIVRCTRAPSRTETECSRYETRGRPEVWRFRNAPITFWVCGLNITDNAQLEVDWCQVMENLLNCSCDISRYWIHVLNANFIKKLGLFLWTGINSILPDFDGNCLLVL